MLIKADENGTHQPVNDVVQRANKLGAFCKCLLFGSFRQAKKDWICKQAASVRILKWKARPVSLCFVFRLCLGAGQVLQGGVDHEGLRVALKCSCTSLQTSGSRVIVFFPAQRCLLPVYFAGSFLKMCFKS